MTSVVNSNLSLKEVNGLYKSFYERHPFTHVADSMIDMKQTVNTNKCLVFIEKIGDQLAVHSALDNLLKGASGQAVQNLNLMFGLDEIEGLKLKGIIF